MHTNYKGGSECVHTVESSQYCICKLDVGGAMLDCNNAAYEKGAWFHLECLGLEEDEVVDKEYCGFVKKIACKKKRRESMDIFRDCKQTYTKRLLWRGLNNMARHDAIRENDGARLIMQWQFYMLNFFEKIIQNNSYLEKDFF